MTTTVAGGCVVEVNRQPEYEPLPGCEIGDGENVAAWLADRHVVTGAGGTPCVIDASSGRVPTFEEPAERSDLLARRGRP